MEEDGERKKVKPLTFAGKFSYNSGSGRHVVAPGSLKSFLFSLGLTALAQALDSKQAHTSFGKLPLSVEKTAPQYNFPKAKRDDGAKLFMGELTKTDNAGKNSPGPVYIYQDQVKYDCVSNC